MGKVGNVISRGQCKKRDRNSRNKKIIKALTEMKNAFDVLIRRLDTVRGRRISEPEDMHEWLQETSHTTSCLAKQP